MGGKGKTGKRDKDMEAGGRKKTRRLTLTFTKKPIEPTRWAAADRPPDGKGRKK